MLHIRIVTAPRSPRNGENAVEALAAWAPAGAQAKADLIADLRAATAEYLYRKKFEPLPEGT